MELCSKDKFRRKSPSWEALDPFGPWEDFNKSGKAELKNWREWCKTIRADSNCYQIDVERKLLNTFPILSGVRLWWLKTQELSISPAQIAKEMGQYSKCSTLRDMVSQIEMLLRGKSTDRQGPDNSPLVASSLKVVSTQLLANFAFSCMRLSYGNQDDLQPCRKGGNLQLNRKNSEEKKWRYKLKCQNIYKGKQFPPEVFWEEIDKDFDENLKSTSEAIFQEFQLIDGQRWNFPKIQILYDERKPEVNIRSTNSQWSNHVRCKDIVIALDKIQLSSPEIIKTYLYELQQDGSIKFQFLTSTNNPGK